MRRFLVSTFFATCFIPVAHAQNYVPAANYNGPDVVVNLDILGATPGGFQSAPVYQRPLPPLRPPMMRPPSAPVRLTPPAQRPAQIASAPVLRNLAPAPIAPPKPAPAPLAADEMLPPPVAAKPAVKPAPFLARDTAEMASSPAMPPVAPLEPIKPANTAKTQQGRTLLAQARDKADSDDAAKREVVLFDKAPNTEKPLTAPPVEQKLAMATPAKPIAPAPSQDDLNDTATKVDDFEAYRLLFGRDKTDLATSEQDVVTKVAAKLKAEPNTKLQLRAYADGTPDTSAQARRVSLTRALNVRSALLQQGITATRLDVRALGMGSADMNDQVGKGNIPADRVDLILVR